MKHSPLIFLVFGLMSWAWLSGTWIAAAILLSFIFISKLSVWRWQITQAQFHRWGDLCSLLIVMMLVYVYVLKSINQPIFIVLKWLPVLFAPVLLAQLFSNQQKLPLGSLFYSMRKQADKQPRYIDFQPSYAALTVLSAGAANTQNNAYFILSVALFLGVLFVAKPKQSPLFLWLIVIVFAVVSSFFAQQGLRKLHQHIEEQSVEWLSQWNSDPFKSQTSIGDIGDLKLSDKIVFRVKTSAPLLLHQASYNMYFGQQWSASKRVFTYNNPDKPLAQEKLQHLEILQSFKRKEILALPDGVDEITGLEGATLEYTEFGVVKITDAPSFARYQVAYTGFKKSKANRFDTKLPKQHLDWLESLSQKMQLSDLESPQQTSDKIKRYFRKNFYYSLFLGVDSDADSALRSFILERQAGHCEYFAVATVFLLRQAGIPARLANGYMVDEYDEQTQQYIVRRRHAHAWAIAHINGVWQAVDSTPSQWLAMEADNASWLQPLSDAWSNIVLQFKQWQLNRTEDQGNLIWMSVVLLLMLYLVWRIYSAKRQLNRIKAKSSQLLEFDLQGLDSEFYLLEQHLNNTPQARQANESIQQWVLRVQVPILKDCYHWHYQLRFDPRGLSVTHWQQLQQQVKAWLGNENA